MRELVENTLKELEKYSPDAVNLILGTIAQESHYGEYRRQLGNGPALGICQVEPETFNDCIVNYINFRHELKRKIYEVCHITSFSVNDLVDNDRLSICIARVKYQRDKQPIPDTLEGYADYWKRVYNSPIGEGKPEEFIENYKRYVIHEEETV